MPLRPTYQAQNIAYTSATALQIPIAEIIVGSPIIIAATAAYYIVLLY